MSLRIFNDDNQEKECRTEESVFCTIYFLNMMSSFFVKISDIDNIKELASSKSEDLFKIQYIQRMYNPIDDTESIAHGEFYVLPHNILSVSFEKSPDFPPFYL
jgi:hypothetical protein